MVAGNITSVTLFGPVSLDAGPNAVMIRHYSGTITTHLVNEISVTTDTLTFTTPYADTTQIGEECTVVVGSAARQWRRLIITDIQTNEDFVASITMADEAPDLIAEIV